MWSKSAPVVVKSNRRESGPARRRPTAQCSRLPYPNVIQYDVVDERLDIDLLDESDPFEIDHQAAHLFKHAPLGIDNIREVWTSDPIFNRPSRRRTG